MTQSAVSRIFSRRKKKLSRVRSCGNDINLSLAEILVMKKNCSISRLFTCIWSQYHNTIYLAFVHAEMTQSAVSQIFSRRKKIFITHSFMRKLHKSQSRGNSRSKKNCSISHSFRRIWSQSNRCPAFHASIVSLRTWRSEHDAIIIQYGDYTLWPWRVVNLSSKMYYHSLNDF
jgi:hypothetical protein